MIVGHCIASPHLSHSRQSSPTQVAPLDQDYKLHIDAAAMYPYIFGEPETSKRFGPSTLYDQGRKMKEVRGPKEIGFLVAS